MHEVHIFVLELRFEGVRYEVHFFMLGLRFDGARCDVRIFVLGFEGARLTQRPIT